MRLVPDELWVLAQSLISQFTPSPQGGEMAPVEDRAVLTVLDELGSQRLIDWPRAIPSGGSVREKKGES